MRSKVDVRDSSRAQPQLAGKGDRRVFNGCCCVLSYIYAISGSLAGPGVSSFSQNHSSY